MESICTLIMGIAFGKLGARCYLKKDYEGMIISIVGFIAGGGYIILKNQ